MQLTSIARTSALVTALLGAALSAPAGAHQIWLEQDDQHASVYFGEFGDNLREVSPGLLDKFSLNNARLVAAGGSSKALQASKRAAAFTLNGKVAAGETIIVEENSYPGWENKQDGKTTYAIWTPAARLVADHSAQKPALTLDLVPTGKPGQFQLSYRGKPLADTKVNAVVQSGWAREAWSDKQGMVSFALPWQGRYVLEVHHEDKTGGERDGRHYDQASYVTTLSLVQPQGVAPLPAPPAAAPGKDHG